MLRFLTNHQQNSKLYHWLLFPRHPPLICSPAISLLRVGVLAFVFLLLPWFSIVIVERVRRSR